MTTLCNVTFSRLCEVASGKRISSKIVASSLVVMTPCATSCEG